MATLFNKTAIDTLSQRNPFRWRDDNAVPNDVNQQSIDYNNWDERRSLNLEEISRLTAEQRKQIVDANNARIAELQKELAQIKSTQGDYTDMDALDLELAANRANAYDMNGSTTALSRLESRMQNRVKERNDLARTNANKESENALKRSEIEKTIRETQIKRSTAKTLAEKNIYDAQLQDLGNKLKALGGTYVPAKYEGADVADAMDTYFRNTANTAKGRKLKDDVDEARRSQIVDLLRQVGEYEKADEIEATKTTGEKQTESKNESAKKNKLKTQIMAINRVLGSTRNSTDTDSSRLRAKAQQAAEKLVRNYPSYVKIENGMLKFTAKD